VECGQNVFKSFSTILISFFSYSGPLGNPVGSGGGGGGGGGSGSGAPSGANSRSASRENLCEECVQNPLDLVDASIQVSKLTRNMPSKENFKLK